MSTKKEKCCEVCESPNGCITAFIGQNCPCHQSESIEWEKELKLLLENQGIDTTEEGGNQIFQEQKDLFSQAITTAVAKRELEIAEEVEKKSFRGFAPYEQDYLIKKEDVLSILKH